MKKLFCVVLALVLALGCVPFASADEAVELRFLDVSPSPTRQEYFETTFAKFEEETGIKVIYESVPWDDAADKLTVLGMSNQLPDVITCWAGWLGQFTEAEWVIPLTDYLGDSVNDFSKIVTDITWKAELQLYGDYYTVPDGEMVKGVFIRKDWCEEEGIELDYENGWTYDEYFDVVHKLTNPEKNRYGTSFRGARGAFDPLFVYLESFNGGYAYAEDGSTLITSDECLEGYKKWMDLYLDGCAPKDAINWGFTEMVDNFCGGLTGTLINDSEVAATCLANMDDSQWAVMPMPRGTDGKIQNTVNAPYSYAITADSENPDQAWELISYLSRADINIEYCKLFGLVPVKSDVGDDPLYGPDGPYATFMAELNDPDLVVPCAFGPFDYTDLHQSTMHEEMQRYLLGEEDAETALHAVADELEARMKEYLAENPGSTVEEPKSIS